MEADDGGTRKLARERPEPPERTNGRPLREGADRGGRLHDGIVRREPRGGLELALRRDRRRETARARGRSGASPSTSALPRSAGEHAGAARPTTAHSAAPTASTMSGRPGLELG